MKPTQIHQVLDRYIIGQSDAKKAVAIALRNRWRRKKIPQPLQSEITPKNILMSGPTGVGKTEIARRLAHLAGAPFLKIEATKFTEVGYVGKNVESIVQDLVNSAITLAKKEAQQTINEQATQLAQKNILKLLLAQQQNNPQIANKNQTELEKFLKTDQLDEQTITIEFENIPKQIEFATTISDISSINEQIEKMIQTIKKDKITRKTLTVKEAKKLLTQKESENLIDEQHLQKQALQNAQENGIVFIDEIDKITHNSETPNYGNGEISREGVQRDLLSLIEGCEVKTRFGLVSTNHVLFICAGAFHSSKVSDLLPELQGRLPIHIKLNPLTADDLQCILQQPDSALTKQYQALLKTEGITLSFNNDAIEEIAQLAFFMNENQQNIGARRLHSLLEAILKDILFQAPDLSRKKIIITKKEVKNTLKTHYQAQNLKKYIL